MRLLAVDTALGACSACVLDGDEIRARLYEPMERGHAERLAPMVRETMVAAGLAFGALDRLAVTTGPGTFTGQRVGYAFMRGLRLALKRPLIGITTLEAMGAAARDETGADAAAVLHDARRGEVYFALVSQQDVVLSAQLATLDEALGAVRKAAAELKPAVLAFAGTARQEAARQYGAAGNTLVSTVEQPDALFVARLSMGMAESQDIPPPLYLRAPDAKLPGQR